MARGFAIVALLLSAAHNVAAQGATPQLSRQQRETLRQIVAAVDAASGEPDTPVVSWQMHRLRASDGSHYVAFSVEPSARDENTTGPLMLYVRLATARLSGQGVERSAVGEWLAGRRSDPLMRPRTAIAIGDMPNFGAGAIAVRGSTASTGSNDLKLMELERQRARQEQEERDKKRRAELEGATQSKRDLLPFEDFDLAASLSTATGAIQRALTAGPGDYELYVAWTDSSPTPAPIQVLKRTLHLPPANATELAISDVIIADQVGTRPAPYPPAQQAAHPYAIGLTDITIARDTLFSRDDRLNVAFQVINPRSSETGKPDIAITFRIARVNGDREQPVASLTPQQYTADTLPGDFDLRLGHPIFAAMSVPLATLTRGQYRLKVAVNDRLSGRGTTGDADFTVVGTPASLLAEAPSVAVAFRREMALEPAVIEEVATRFRPASPSMALTRALDLLRQRKFLELLREEPVGTRELGHRAALTGVALYALGDASSIVQFQRAVQLDVPPAPAQLFIGAARALEGRDADAIPAWENALQSGMPRAIVAPLLINAHLRKGDVAKAASLVEQNPGAEWSRDQVALLIASGREREAIPLLERRTTSAPEDADAEWLLLHALYASIVRGPNQPPDRTTLDTFAQAARAYIDKTGANRSLASEWLKAVEP